MEEGFFERLIAPFRSAPPKKRMPPKRMATEEEREAWFDAADSRPPPRKRDRNILREHLKDANPWRWRRLQSDMDWVEHELGKLGMLPDEARWIV